MATNPDFTDMLPRPEEFSKALYILDCGQNDLHYGLIKTTEEQVKASIPNIISQFAVILKYIHKYMIDMICLYLDDMLLIHLKFKSHD